MPQGASTRRALGRAAASQRRIMVAGPACPVCPQASFVSVGRRPTSKWRLGASVVLTAAIWGAVLALTFVRGQM